MPIDNQRGGGASARLVVIAAGYAKTADAQADAKAFAVAFQSQVTPPVQWFVLDSRAGVLAIQDAVASASGIFITAPDQSTVLGALGSAPAMEVLNSIRAALPPSRRKIESRLLLSMRLKPDQPISGALPLKKRLSTLAQNYPTSKMVVPRDPTVVLFFALKLM